MKKLNNLLNKDFLYISTMLCICVIVVITITYLSRNCTFYGDDLTCGLYHNNWFDSLNPTSINSAFKIHGGGYLSLFLSNIFNYNIPHFLGIHPSDFIGIPYGILKGFFFTFVLISISNFLTIYKKSKVLYLLIFISVFLYFIYKIVDINSFVIAFNHSFHRYIFPLLFYVLFLDYIYKNVFMNVDNNKVKLLVAVISSVILGLSVEILSYSLLLLTLFLCIYKKFKLSKTFYIPVLSLYISLFLFMSSSGFKFVAMQRGLNNINLSIIEFSEFISKFGEVCIFKNPIVWILFIISFIISLWIAKNKEKTFSSIVFPAFLQISIFLVMFSLYFCGKSFYVEGEFWLSHPNIQFLYSILILLPTFLYINYLIQFIPIKKNFILLFIVSFIFISIDFIYKIENLIEKSYWYSNDCTLSRIKKLNYIVEKMYRFYHLKNEKIYLPIELLLYEKPYIDYFLWSRDCFEIRENKYCEYGVFNTKYLPKIYKDFSIKKYYFVDNAIEKFYSEGGSFTKEELCNIKFKRLYDNKFVLNQEEEKLILNNIYPIF